MDMGEVIKMHRQRLGLSQQELGEKVGVNKAAVQKWESGIVENIKRSVIKKLSLIFDICPTELLGWSDQWSDCISQKSLENNPLTTNEQQLLTKYRCLNDRGREKVTEYVDDLLDNEKYTSEQFPDEESRRA